MLKKFAITVGALVSLIALACSSNDASDIAGGTVDPNTLATESSSSGDIKILPISSTEDVVSSSSSKGTNNNGHTIRCDECSSSGEGDNNGVDPIPVSSSSEIRDGGIARANDFFIQCKEDVGAPEVFRHVEGDSVKFVLQNVYFDIPCDKDQREAYIEFLNTDRPFPIGREGDTLIVAPYHGDGVYDCSCAAEATFTLNKAYTAINYTVFDRKEPLPVQEK